MERYNIALVFGQEVSEKIVSYARDLYRLIPSDVVLGENSRPHMTIAQFELQQDQAKEIWEYCESSVVETPALNFSGLTILPSSKGGAWLEISVLKSHELLVIQDKMKRIIETYAVLKNDSGDDYRPHVTIAHTTTGNSFSNLPYSYEPVRLESVHTKLAIGLGTAFDLTKNPF